MRPESISNAARLAALADRTLPASQRERALAEVSESPERTEELERQRQAVEMLRAIDAVQAPPALRSSIEALAADAPRFERALQRLRVRRLAFAGAGLAALAVAALALSGGKRDAPTVTQAARLAQLPATLPAPQESASDNGTLAISAAGIAYPYWQSSLGWQASGVRTDSLSGRKVTTVFYSRLTAGHTQRVGYAIVSGGALPLPAAASIDRQGVTYRVLSHDGVTIVTWRRGGHTCVLAAHGLATRTLVRLASWQ